MKKREFNNLKERPSKDLIKMVSEKKMTLSKKIMEVATGKEKNLKVLRNFKREIAQVLSLIKEKEIMEKLQSIDNKKGKENVQSL